jgi:O-antigen/teichoic acid export membrane protein
MSIHANLKKSVGISFATQYAEFAIHLLGMLVLARILSPDDIGTYSIAAFVMAVLHGFRDFGVIQYLIQEPELTRDKIRSAMGVAIILALAMALLVLAGSAPIARFYGNPAIRDILLVMAASFAISPFGSILIGIYRREMNLLAMFFISLASAICHVAVAILLAMSGYGPMSLAWANFAGILSFGIAANLLRPKGIPWLPRFTRIRPVLSFGSFVSVSNAANTAGTNMPDMIVGKVMDLAAVGYLSRANGLIQLFAKLSSEAVMPLVSPYFAHIRRQDGDQAATYLIAVEYLTAFAWPFFAVMLLLAQQVVRALYGPQWDASVPLVEVLCLAGAVSSISLLAGQVMVANAQVRYFANCQLIAQPVRIAAVVVASAHGLLAVAVALVVSECFALLVISWYLHRTIKVRPAELLRACRKSVFVAFCAALVPLAVRIFWRGDPSNPWPALSAGVLGAALGWIAGIIVTGHPLSRHGPLRKLIPS